MKTNTITDINNQEKKHHSKPGHVKHKKKQNAFYEYFQMINEDRKSPPKNDNKGKNNINSKNSQNTNPYSPQNNKILALNENNNSKNQSIKAPFKSLIQATKTESLNTPQNKNSKILKRANIKNSDINTIIATIKKLKSTKSSTKSSNVEKTDNYRVAHTKNNHRKESHLSKTFQQNHKESVYSQAKDSLNKAVIIQTQAQQPPKDHQNIQSLTPSISFTHTSSIHSLITDHIKEGKSHFVINLHPNKLGTVKIHINTLQKNHHIQLEVKLNDTKILFAQELPALENLLRQSLPKVSLSLLNSHSDEVESRITKAGKRAKNKE